MDKQKTTDKQILSDLTKELLRPAIDYTSIRKACASLSDFFCKVSGFDPDDQLNQRSVSTESGKAISPSGAMSCITDMMRTRNFLLGIHDAIHSRLQKDPRRPIIVLYAGTGPFATLLTPLTSVFSPGELQMVLMDINPVSTDNLKNLIGRLGAEPYITAIETADAASYQLPGSQQPDILVTETMKPGLLNEPQFAICANLLPQCVRDPVLIPEMIKVDCCLLGKMSSDNYNMQKLSTLIRLQKSLFDGSAASQKELDIIREGRLVSIPAIQAGSGNQVILDTSIRIFQQHELRLNESGLTIPVRPVEFLQNNPLAGTWRIRYIINEEPRFEITKELHHK